MHCIHVWRRSYFPVSGTSIPVSGTSIRVSVQDDPGLSCSLVLL